MGFCVFSTTTKKAFNTWSILLVFPFISSGLSPFLRRVLLRWCYFSIWLLQLGSCGMRQLRSVSNLPISAQSLLKQPREHWAPRSWLSKGTQNIQRLLKSRKGRVFPAGSGQKHWASCGVPTAVWRWVLQPALKGWPCRSQQPAPQMQLY